VPLELPVVVSEVTLVPAAVQFSAVTLGSIGAPLQRVNVRPEKRLSVFPVRWRDRGR
jgi:hypothetical protein